MIIIVFYVSRYDYNNLFWGWPQKNGYGPKNSIFGPQKGHFGQSGPRNGPPGGQTATYRKTEGNQSYLRI